MDKKTERKGRVSVRGVDLLYFTNITLRNFNRTKLYRISTPVRDPFLTSKRVKETTSTTPIFSPRETRFPRGLVQAERGVMKGLSKRRCKWYMVSLSVGVR